MVGGNFQANWSRERKKRRSPCTPQGNEMSEGLLTHGQVPLRVGFSEVASFCCSSLIYSNKQISNNFKNKVMRSCTFYGKHLSRYKGLLQTARVQSQSRTSVTTDR